MPSDIAVKNITGQVPGTGLNTYFSMTQLYISSGKSFKKTKSFFIDLYMITFLH